jgi:ABC-type multidrug transport system ATPase subunit
VCGHTEAAEIRPCVSVVFQFIALDRHLTVYENLRDQAALYGIPRREAAARIAGAINGAGLAERRHDPVKTLSRGLARRADLARALLHRPSLLLLDEPTSGLDPGAREAFLDGVLAGGDQGPSIILMSTHLVDEADRCDRVVMLHEGRVVADGTPRELRLRSEGAPLITLASAGTPPDLDGVRWERGAGGSFRGRADDARAAERCVARLAALGAAFCYDPSTTWTLAEVFERLTGRPLSPPEAERTEGGR